jgi:hypothetical protein
MCVYNLVDFFILPLKFELYIFCENKEKLENQKHELLIPKSLYDRNQQADTPIFAIKLQLFCTQILYYLYLYSSCTVFIAFFLLRLKMCCFQG